MGFGPTVVWLIRDLPRRETHRGLQLSEKIGDFRLAPVHCPNELAANDAVSVDDISLRKLEGAVKVAGFLVGIAHGEKVDLMVFQEAVVPVVIDVYTDSDDRYSFVLEALLHLGQGRHFFHARRTPGRPEIQHYNFAAEVPQFHLMVSVLHDEVGSGSANSGWTGTAITTAKYRKTHQQRKNGDASHTDIIIDSGRPKWWIHMQSALWCQ